jgi:hypothetical protein
LSLLRTATPLLVYEQCPAGFLWGRLCSPHLAVLSPAGR